MENKFNYKLGDKVKHSCDLDSFEVVGLRKDSIEIKGDWSGGTNPCNQSSWVKYDEVSPYKSLDTVEKRVKYQDTILVL